MNDEKENLNIVIRNISKENKEKIKEIIESDKETYYKSFESIPHANLFDHIEKDLKDVYKGNCSPKSIEKKELFKLSSKLYDQIISEGDKHLFVGRAYKYGGYGLEENDYDELITSVFSDNKDEEENE